MDELEDLDRATAGVAGILDRVRDDQWQRPTACSEWNVREVVNHLAHGALKAAAWVSGRAEPAEDDHLGTDVRAGFETTAGQVRALFGAPGFLERTFETPLGPVSGAMLVASRVNELLVHGWDVAEATGQATDIEPELAEQALALWRAHLGDGPRPDGSPFAEAQQPAHDATAADRLAAFLGRRPVLP